MGLAHILERRTQDFIQKGFRDSEAKEKSIQLIEQIPQILQDSRIYKEADNKIELITDKYTLVLGLRDDKKFIVTALQDRRNAKRLETIQTRVADDFTSETLANKPLSQNQQTDSTTTLAQYQETLNNTLNTQGKLQVSGFEVKGKSYDPQIELLKISKAKEAQTTKQIPKDIYELEKEESILVAKLDKNKLKDFLQNAKNPQESKQVLAQNIANTIISYQGGGVPEREMYKVLQQIEFLEQQAKLVHSSLQNPKLDYALKEYKDLSKQELEELISKGERSEVRVSEIDGHNFQTQEITYYKDTTKYTGQIGNYLDESLGMEGNDFYLAKVSKTQNAIDPKHWERDLRSLCEKALKMPRDEAIDFLEDMTSKNPQIFSPTSELYKKAQAIMREYGEKELKHNIYQSNAHIGSGMLGGSVAGVETDEQGNIIGFDPAKFALGFLGGAGGSLAATKGFKVLKEKPELKEALKKELANTLSKGWENATNQYPLLKSLEPVKHIMQSEKGRIAQANHILNKLEKENLEQTKETIIKTLDDLKAENLPKEINKEEFLSKGLSKVINKENFVKHLEKSQDSSVRLKYLNLIEPTQQRANIEFTQGERKGYIKAFKDENKNLFYVLITEDKDKILITGIPTSKKREVIRQIKKADSIIRRMDSIDTLSPTAKATTNVESVSTSQANSTISNALLSKAQKKFNYDEKKASDLLGVKVSVAQLKRFLKDYGERGYHHTSKMYNKTPFYSIAEAFGNISKQELEEYFKK